MTFASLEATYRQWVEEGSILPDAAQAETVLALRDILEQWEAKPKRGLFGRKPKETQGPQGIYLWGDVGRGKSLLMDLLFQSADMPKKKRVHYHPFMLDVHGRMHKLKNVADPLPVIARDIGKEAQLLCLDELQVTDIADAMMLARLFTALLDEGVRVTFTSNRAPEALYLNGLQRERFLPFIALLRQQFRVMKLESAEDYRLKQLKSLRQTCFTGVAREAELQAAYALLTHDAAPERVEIPVQGRVLKVEQSHGDVAWMTFGALCARPLGAADYEALAQQFSTLCLAQVPLLTPEKRNEAKRFVTLVDTLYEHKVKLLMAAEAEPQALYPAGDGAFEFQRTVSRLMEMQAETYLSIPHKVEQKQAA